MSFLTRLWRTAPLLVATGLLLAALVVPFGIGMLVDPRVITGAPAWLKPLKFAISTAVYAVTLAWVFTYLPDWPRTRRIVGAGTALAFVIELLLIGGQAARGTTSHFNRGTPFDSAVFTVMGIAIVLQTLLAASLAVVLWRQRFADPALGWALRIGTIVTVLGAFTGGLMTRPTAAQIADARTGGAMLITGAHTVGAPDGGPGLPVTGWSTRHGDVRVPHFVGLHAWQALPLFVVVALRRFRDTTRARLALLAGFGYGALFIALLVQALRGVPLVSL